jgi:hypothetical protein
VIKHTDTGLVRWNSETLRDEEVTPVPGLDPNDRARLTEVRDFLLQNHEHVGLLDVLVSTIGAPRNIR